MASILSAYALACAADRTGRYARHHLAGLNRVGHDRARGHHATIAKPNPLENDRFRADPAPITDTDIASVHGPFARQRAMTELVIAIGDVHIGAEHVVVADLDRSTCVNHHVAIEIVRVPDSNSNARKVGVFGP